MRANVVVPPMSTCFSMPSEGEIRDRQDAVSEDQHKIKKSLEIVVRGSTIVWSTGAVGPPVRDNVTGSADDLQAHA